MLYNRRSRCRPVSLALVGLFLWVTACGTYKQIELGEVADHATVRVTLKDGDRELIRDPLVEADTIRGIVETGRTAAGTVVSPWAVELEQVTKIEAEKVNTAAAVAGVLLVAFAFGYLIWLSSVDLFESSD